SASHPRSFVSRKGLAKTPPALFTSTSTPPHRSHVAATARSKASPSRTSVGRPTASPPAARISASADAARSGASSRIATRAPYFAKPRAIPRPIPAPAPVTTATLPSRETESGNIARIYSGSGHVPVPLVGHDRVERSRKQRGDAGIGPALLDGGAKPEG